MPESPDLRREFAYVADSSGDAVTVLDLVALQTDRTLKVAANPVAIAVSPTRDQVYVLSRRPGQANGSLTVVDTRTNQLAGAVPTGREPGALAVSPDGTRVYLASTGSGLIQTVDPQSRRVLSSVAGTQPDGLAMAPDGRTLVVTSRMLGSVSLYTLHPAGPPVLRSTFAGCPGAASPVVLPDNSKAFVACSYGHQVLVAGLAEPPASWHVQQDAALAGDRMLALLDVGQRPAHLTMKPDGGEIFVSNTGSDSVSEIATYTNEVGSTYPIGNQPSQGVVSRDRGALWIAATGSDALSLYSIDDGKMISSIPGGSGPDALAFSADERLLLAADAHSGDVAVIRTQNKFGPALLTILPAGGDPSAIVIKAMDGKP